MEAPQMLELVPDLPEVDFEYSDLLESFQRLNDFGYIKDADFQGFNKKKEKKHFLKNLLPSAVRKFRLEYRDLLHIGNQSINNLAVSTDLDDHLPETSEGYLTPEEMAFLSQLSSYRLRLN